MGGAGSVRSTRADPQVPGPPNAPGAVNPGTPQASRPTGSSQSLLLKTPPRPPLQHTPPPRPWVRNGVVRTAVARGGSDNCSKGPCTDVTQLAATVGGDQPADATVGAAAELPPPSLKPPSVEPASPKQPSSHLHHCVGCQQCGTGHGRITCLTPCCVGCGTGRLVRHQASRTSRPCGHIGRSSAR